MLKICIKTENYIDCKQGKGISLSTLVGVPPNPKCKFFEICKTPSAWLRAKNANKKKR